MQQLQTLRRRAGAQAEWLRVGVLSATVVTPLVARWQQLRAAQHARTWRTQMGERLDAARARLPQTALPALPRAAGPLAERLGERVRTSTRGRRANVRTGLWLAGVGVGVLAAGAGAYLLVRRRLAATAQEPMLDLPDVTQNGTSNPEQTTRAQEAAPPAPPAPAAAEEDVSIVEIAAVERAEDAAFVGNIRTMVFHNASDVDALPAEENRVYFASEDDAVAAGYRRNRGELPQEPSPSSQVSGPVS